MADPPATPAWDPEDYVPRLAHEVDPERLNFAAVRMRAASDQALSPRRAGLKELADAARLLIDRMLATNAPDDVIEAATRDIAAVAERFAEHQQVQHYGISESANAGGAENPLFDHSPMIGIANPLAPPMRLHEQDGEIVAEVRFGLAYEGPPGCVHGGYVAAAFDELLGATQSLSGAPGMTGTLSVRYESPTPLLTDLRFVGRLTGVERRKIFVEGECYDGDHVTARATGIFISLNPGMFLDLIAEREARQADQR